MLSSAASLPGNKPVVEVELWSPHELQAQMVDDPRRFKIFRCGRRFGKTTAIVDGECIEDGLEKDLQEIFYIGPTYRQAKMIAWDMLLRDVRRLPPSFIRKINEQQLYVIIGKRTRISIKGADNPDSLRGVRIDKAIFDEFDSMKFTVWWEVIRPALMDSKGRAVFGGTPKGYRNLFKLEQEAKTDPDWGVFHYTSYDNPHIENAEVDAMRAQMSEDLFAQEALAEYRRFSGLVYRDFDPDVHVVADVDPDPSWAVFRAVDFGYHNPTAWLWIGVDADDDWHVYDELYVTETVTPSIAQAVKARTGARRVVDSFGDPAGAQMIADYKNLGIPIRAASRETGAGAVGWVEGGIDRVAARLIKSHRTGKPRLFVSSRCVNLIAEFQTYQWDDRVDSTKNQSRIPRKENDHALDALRMFAVSYRGGEMQRERSVFERVARQRSITDEIDAYRGAIRDGRVKRGGKTFR